MAFDGSYPAPPGNKRHSFIDIKGPASYTAVTPGVPPTGGQAVSAASFGLTSIEFAHVQGSDDGQFAGNIYMNPFNSNQPSPNMILQWLTAATGAEVAGATNLSARTMRIHAWGSY